MYACLVLIFIVQKSFLPKNYFLTAEINLTIRGLLQTWLIVVVHVCWHASYAILDPLYPKGSYVITPVCGPYLCVSVFEYLRDSSLVFSKTLHEARGQ